MEITVNQFDTMTEDEIIAEAHRRGCTTYKDDGWVCRANNRLWQIQTGQS